MTEAQSLRLILVLTVMLVAVLMLKGRAPRGW